MVKIFTDVKAYVFIWWFSKASKQHLAFDSFTTGVYSPG
jgi:hypothetical protein